MKKKYLTLGILALGLISCGGETDPAVAEMSKPKVEETTAEAEEVTEEPVATEEVAETTEETKDYSAGKTVFDKTCKACHQENGEGIPGAFPPLAKSDYLLADKTRAIKQVLEGSSGEITVNGETFNGTMPAQILEDQEVVDVLNYVLNSWGNDGGEVTLEEVQSQKSNG